MHARPAGMWALLGAVAIVAIVASGGAGPVNADLLIVLNKSDHEAVLVDPARLAPVARIPTGRGPHEVAVSPDGRRAYVSNYGMYGVFREGQRVNEPGHPLSVIALERRAVVDTFDLGTYAKPHGIAVSRDGTALWVTCEDSRAVLEVDAASGRVVKAWTTGQETSHMIVPAVDESRLFVANIRSGSETMRKAAADIYGRNLSHDVVADKCVERLEEFFSDEAESVRQEVSSAFFQVSGKRLLQLEEFIARFIESKCFENETDRLLHALEQSNVELPHIICRAAERFLDFLGEEGTHIAYRGSMVAHSISTLVVRQYEQTTDDAIKTHCLDLIDRMERVGYLGIGDQLNRIDR